MRRALALTTALGGLGYAGLRRNTQQILANPDPASADVLRGQLPGQVTRIQRPDGTSIKVVVDGHGPDVVLAHGYAVSSRSWALVQRLLVDAGFRVTAFDWRGQGETTIGSDGVQPEVIAGDYVAIFEELGLTDAVLVGHSTGGYLAIATLLEHPTFADRLRGLVLFGSFAGDALKGAPQNKLQIPLIRTGLLQRMLRASEDVALAFGASIYGPDPSPVACQVFVEDFLASDLEGTAPLLERISTTGFYDRLGEITVPTVVVCGELDRTTPRWHSEEMGRRIPEAHNVWVPGKGHGINWSEPEALVEVVQQLTK